MRRLILVVVLVLLTFTAQAADRYPPGILYSVVDDAKGTFLARWDWTRNRWVDLFPNVKHAMWKEDGIPSNPLIPLGESQFLTQINRRLVLVSSSGARKTILDKEISTFCYNSGKQLIFVITCQGSLECVSWPDLKVKTINPHPPLTATAGWPASISSAGDVLVLGGGDARIYQAKIGDYVFSPVADGICPKFSPSGKKLAYSETPPSETVIAVIRELRGNTTRSYAIERALPIPMWIGEDILVYQYREPVPFSEDRIRFAALFLKQGKRQAIRLEPAFVGSFTWAAD